MTRKRLTARAYGYLGAVLFSVAAWAALLFGIFN